MTAEAVPTPEELGELVERSSLGTTAAKVLRALTTDDEVAAVNELINRQTGTTACARETGPKAHIEPDNTGDHNERR